MEQDIQRALLVEGALAARIQAATLASRWPGRDAGLGGGLSGGGGGGGTNTTTTGKDNGKDTGNVIRKAAIAGKWHTAATRAITR